MSSKKSSPKPKENVSSDGALLGFDLLHQLSYLSAISAAGIPRSQIFRLASKLPVSTSCYFDEINRLAESMNYDYAEACRVVGERAKDEQVRSLLLRLSGALGSGEPEMDFMKREAEIQAESYGNEYERKVEALKKWTEGYAALVVSAVMIIVVAAISTMIYDIGIQVVVGLVVVTVVVSAIGAYMIYRAAPQEPTCLPGEQGKPSQRMPRQLLVMLLPTSVAVSAVMIVAGFSMGWVMIVVAAIIFPLGVFSGRFDGHVSQRDRDIPTFLRVLGATASAIGTTTAEAMGRIDVRSIAALAPSVKQLRVRLQSKASTELCWQRFVVDTGSELVGRTVQVFVDGVRLGGDPDEVGSRSSIMAMKISFLRARRKAVSVGFSWLTVALHATVVFLLMFVMDIVNGFGNMLGRAGVADIQSGSASQASVSVFSFNLQNMHFLQSLMIPVVILLSVINSMAMQLADGGYFNKFFLFLSITLLSAGAATVISPVLAGMIFGIASKPM